MRGWVSVYWLWADGVIASLEKQCWKGEQKQGGWRPASSLGSGQIYGIPESSGQTGHPHTNDTGIAGSDSAPGLCRGSH